MSIWKQWHAFFHVQLLPSSSVILQGREETIQRCKLQDEEHHQQLLFIPLVLFVYKGGKEEVGVMCCKITIVEFNIDF
jgi:hypothetical protein